MLDKTGVTTYIFHVGWDEDQNFLPALEEQLGLKVESGREQLEVLSIERIERPAGN